MSDTTLSVPDQNINPIIDKFIVELSAQGITPGEIEQILAQVQNQFTGSQADVNAAIPSEDFGLDPIRSTLNNLAKESRNKNSKIDADKIEQMIERESDPEKYNSNIKQPMRALLNELGSLATVGKINLIVGALTTARVVLATNGSAASAIKLFLRPGIKAKKLAMDLFFTARAKANLDGKYDSLFLTKFNNSPKDMDLYGKEKPTSFADILTYDRLKSLTKKNKPKYEVQSFNVGSAKDDYEYPGSEVVPNTLSPTMLDFLAYARARSDFGASYTNLFDVKIFPSEGQTAGGNVGSNPIENDLDFNFACTGVNVDGLTLSNSRECLDLPLPVQGKGIQTIRLSMLDYTYRSIYTYFYLWYSRFYNPHKRRFVEGMEGKYKNIQIDVYTLGLKGEGSMGKGGLSDYTLTQSISAVNCIPQDVPSISLSYSEGKAFTFDVTVVPTDVFVNSNSYIKGRL